MKHLDKCHRDKILHSVCLVTSTFSFTQQDRRDVFIDSIYGLEQDFIVGVQESCRAFNRIDMDVTPLYCGGTLDLHPLVTCWYRKTVLFLLIMIFSGSLSEFGLKANDNFLFFCSKRSNRILMWLFWNKLRIFNKLRQILKSKFF